MLSFFRFSFRIFLSWEIPENVCWQLLSSHANEHCVTRFCSVLACDYWTTKPRDQPGSWRSRSFFLFVFKGKKKTGLIFHLVSILHFFFLNTLKCENGLQRSKAGSIRGTCHLRWRCFVWFKAIFLWGCECVQKEQESIVDFRHWTTYTQCKPKHFHFFFRSLTRPRTLSRLLTGIHTHTNEKKNKHTFTTWQFSLSFFFFFAN